MKVICSSVHCDRCTKSEDFDNEQEQLAAGWLILYDRDNELDFCDKVCLQEFLESE